MKIEERDCRRITPSHEILHPIQNICRRVIYYFNKQKIGKNLEKHSSKRIQKAKWKGEKMNKNKYILYIEIYDEILYT